MESRRTQLVKKPTAALASNAHVKPFSHMPTSLMPQAGSSNYNSKPKTTKVVKAPPSATSRNAAYQDNEANQYQTRTIQLKLTNVSSQSSLHIQQQRVVSRAGREDQEPKSHNSTMSATKQLKRVSTVKQLKSPSPQKIQYVIDNKKIQDQSVLHQPASVRQRVSLEKKIGLSKPLAAKNSKNKANNLKASMISNDSRNADLSRNYFSQTNHSKSSVKGKTDRYHPTGKDIAQAQIQLKSNFQDSLLSPGLYQTLNSPKVSIGVGNVTTTSSIYSNTESIVNQSNYQVLNGKKMSLSEKLAPKQKKKRTNAQKQPKQISITRDQITFQETTLQTQPTVLRKYALPQQKVEINLFSQPSIKSQIEQQLKQRPSSVKKDIWIPKGENPYSQYESTQVFTFDEPEVDNFIEPGTETPIVQEYTKDSFSKPASQRDQVESVHGMFSFHQDPNFNDKSITPEESKEMTGIFGTVIQNEQRVETLGNEIDNRVSTEGLSADQKKFNDIATPVFQENRKNCSFMRSDTVNHQEAKQVEESPKPTTTFNTEKIKQDVFVPKSKIEINQEDIMRSNLQLKKVYSTNDLAVKKAQQFQQLNNSTQSSQSNGSIFNRIKNYFKGNQYTYTDTNNILANLEPDALYRCNCGASGKPYACQRAMNWLSHSNNYKDSEYEKNKQLYEGLIEMKAPSGSENQIERDIPRTFPNVDAFMNSFEGQQKLQRVLNAFSKYDASIGYVQGMNFIVGALLMHGSEDIAFWLFVSLLEDYEMRDIYQPRLPGLYKHSQIIQLLQMEHLNKLYHHFSNHNILIEMYASDWIFCLFSNIIPLQEYHHFLDQFFIGGWSFFYKFSLTFLNALADEVIECQDISEILTIIKLKYTKKDSLVPSDPSNDNTYVTGSEHQSSRRYGDTRSVSPRRALSMQKNGQIQFQVKNIFNKLVGIEEKFTSESFKDDSVWEKIIAYSCREWEEEFNEDYVQNLLSNFDPENLVFRQSFSNTPRIQSLTSSPQKLQVIERESVQTLQISKQSISRDSYAKYDQNYDPSIQMIVTEVTQSVNSQDKQKKQNRSSLPPKLVNGYQPKTAQIILIQSPSGQYTIEKKKSLKNF